MRGRGAEVVDVVGGVRRWTWLVVVIDGGDVGGGGVVGEAVGCDWGVAC